MNLVLFRMSRSRKMFYLTYAVINRILLCDDSDTENAFVLDDEDIDFVEVYVTEMETNQRY